MGAAVDTPVFLRAEHLATVRAPDAPFEARTDVPSARPTSVPDFDMDALATACLHEGNFAVPMDLFVPVRTPASTAGLDLRAAFLLLHVDGQSNISEIAACAQLSLQDVVSSFLRLVALGVVEMTGSSNALRAPESGIFQR